MLALLVPIVPTAASDIDRTTTPIDYSGPGSSDQKSDGEPYTQRDAKNAIPNIHAGRELDALCRKSLTEDCKFGSSHCLGPTSQECRHMTES